MHKVKAIVSDFDGTLVDHSHKLNPKVEAAIRSFIKAGYIFSIATGRAYEGVIEKYCKLLETSELTIVRGGSEILSNKTKEVIWGKYINTGTTKEILDYLNKQSDIFFAVEHKEYIYTVNGISSPELGLDAKYKPLNDLPNLDVPKIVLTTVHSEKLIMNILSELSTNFPNLHLVKIIGKRGMGIDINDGGAGKHMALLEYAKLMNLDPSEILGVGDSYNDYPLLSACGIKVAMGNSPQELKDIADYVVSSQEKNGILEAIDISRNS